jgi:hypothetical protein
VLLDKEAIKRGSVLQFARIGLDRDKEQRTRKNPVALHVGLLLSIDLPIYDLWMSHALVRQGKNVKLSDKLCELFTAQTRNVQTVIYRQNPGLSALIVHELSAHLR